MLPLGFNCGITSTSAWGSSTGVCSWGCPGGLGFAPWGPRGVVVQLFGPQVFWQHQVLRGAGGQGSRKYSAPEGHGNQHWPIRSSILAWRTPSLAEKPGRPQSTGSQRGGHGRGDPARTDAGLFCPWQLCPSEGWVWRRCSCLASRDPGSAERAGTPSDAGVTALSVFSDLYLVIRRPPWPVFLCSSAHSGN